MALRTDSRTDHSDERHSRLMPATWMMALNGSRPAPVSTAPPSGIRPLRRTSRNGSLPPRRLMARDTPCGSRSHQGMRFRVHALTITSTSWSSKSPSTTRKSTEHSPEQPGASVLGALPDHQRGRRPGLALERLRPLLAGHGVADRERVSLNGVDALGRLALVL